MTTTAIIIPARYHSTRLPGKPLAQIRGKSLLYRTWSIAKAVQHVNEVFITTDDERIEAHAKEFGAKVMMTPKECEDGTVRIYHALKNAELAPDVVINLQGDAVLTPPWVIQALVDAMSQDSSIQLGTLATLMTQEQRQQLCDAKNRGEVGGTTVVFNKHRQALYFSKSVIPFQRDTRGAATYRHIGLYGYRFPTLKQYLELPQSPLEISEGLEQLRALENGIPIHIIPVDYKGRTHWAVDSPDDVKIVESIIEKEGELV